MYKDSRAHSQQSEQSGQSGARRRRRRSRSTRGYSLRHDVETLVVADDSMFQYHGNDTQQYVLTLMSIVSQFSTQY